jgi:hypothetical protein
LGYRVPEDYRLYFIQIGRSDLFWISFGAAVLQEVAATAEVEIALAVMMTMMIHATDGMGERQSAATTAWMTTLTKIFWRRVWKEQETGGIFALATAVFLVLTSPVNGDLTMKRYGATLVDRN